MATRARILADYVSSGVTAAEFDFLDTTSGTPGSGTFLRGDKTWVAAGSTSASDLDSGTLAVARMAAGTIIQIVSGTRASEKTTSNTVFEQIHADLEPSITPSSASHKIFVQFDCPSFGNTASQYHIIQILRVVAGVSDVGLGDASMGFGTIYDNTGSNTMAVTSGSILDSPNTTSSVTYKLYQRVTDGDGAAMINGARATITLMEVVV